MAKGFGRSLAIVAVPLWYTRLYTTHVSRPVQTVIAPPIHCDELGDGPPVVLIHGVAFGPAAFRTVAEALVDDHRVLWSTGAATA